MPPIPVVSRTEAIDNLFTVTWRNIKDQVVDQIFTRTPFFNMMVENGRIRQTLAGGRFIDCPIQFAKADSNAKFFRRGDTFGLVDDEFLTQASYEWRYLGTSIVRFFEDDQRNRGKSKLLDFVNAKLMNAQSTLVDILETATFVDDPSGAAFASLGTLVADDPSTGTVAAIDRANNAFWRNQFHDFTGQSVVGDLIPEMTILYNTTSRFKAGSRATPDIIVTSQESYQRYETNARALQQIVANTSVSVSLGFGDLSFKGTPLFWSPACPDGRMYFLNTEHIFFWIDEFAYFDMGPWKEQVSIR